MNHTTWTLVYTPAKQGDGHKLFLCKITGKYAIADWSGNNPSMTEDNVLWIDTSQPGLVLGRDGGRIDVLIPLINRHGDKVHTYTNLGTAKAVATYVKGWKAELAPSVKSAIETLNMIAATSGHAPIPMA